MCVCVCVCSDDLECGGDRIAKLAYADVRRSAALKEALTRHHYSQYTFTPEINPRSRVIGKVGHTHVGLGLGAHQHTQTHMSYSVLSVRMSHRLIAACRTTDYPPLVCVCVCVCVLYCHVLSTTDAHCRRSVS